MCVECSDATHTRLFQDIIHCFCSLEVLEWYAEWLRSAQVKSEQQAMDAGGILLKFNHVFTFRISPSSRVKCRISALGLVKDQTSPYLLELSSRKCT
jgi:hypothetical protein